MRKGQNVRVVSMGGVEIGKLLLNDKTIAVIKRANGEITTIVNYNKIEPAIDRQELMKQLSNKFEQVNSLLSEMAELSKDSQEPFEFNLPNGKLKFTNINPEWTESDCYNTEKYLSEWTWQTNTEYNSYPSTSHWDASDTNC